MVRANLVCQAAFGHLDEEALFKQHRQLREKLELLQNRTMKAKRRYKKSVRELRNEKERQRNRRIRENLKRYKNEQLVIDLEQQLAGKLVDIKMMNALKHKSFMPPQHLMLIDAMLTMSGITLEAECQRRINAINTGTAFCGVKEGRPTRRSTQSRRRPVSDDDSSHPPAKRQRHSVEDEAEILLRQAIKSVRIKSPEERPKICFLCVGNPNLSLENRVAEHKTPDSLTRHFLRKHVNPPWPAEGVECNVCPRELLQQKANLLNHAEAAHGTVVRGRAQERLALEFQYSKEGLCRNRF